jgi:hypothetical protein
MKEVQIPDGWRRYEPGEVRADGDRFCDPLDYEDYSRIENWGKTYAWKNDEEPLVRSLLTSSRLQNHSTKSSSSRFEKFAAQIDAMIRDIKERVQ